MKKTLLILIFSVIGLALVPGGAVFAASPSPESQQIGSAAAADFFYRDYGALTFYDDCIAEGHDEAYCEDQYYQYYLAYANYAAHNAAVDLGEPGVERIPQPSRDDFLRAEIPTQMYPDSNGNPNGCFHEGCC